MRSETKGGAVFFPRPPFQSKKLLQLFMGSRLIFLVRNDYCEASFFLGMDLLYGLSCYRFNIFNSFDGDLFNISR